MSHIQLQAIGEPEQALYTFDKEKLPFTPTHNREPLLGSETRRVAFNAKFGEESVVRIPLGAHFLSDLNLRLELPALSITSGTVASWTNAIGHALIHSVQFVCAGCVLDTINSYTLDFEDEFSNEDLGSIAGKMTDFNVTTDKLESQVIYVPLRFWFTRRLCDALPVGCIDDDIELHIRLRKFENVVVYDGETPPQAHGTIGAEVLAKYYWIDDILFGTFRRKKLHYIIEQHQFASYKVDRTNSQTISLDLSNPVRKFRWCFVDLASIENNDYFNYGVRTTGSTSPLSANPNEPFMDKATLIIDGKEILEGDETYFRKLSVSQPNPSLKLIYSIDFDAKSLPSTLNFSRTDDAVLNVQYLSNRPSHRIMLVAYSYNFMVIHRGCVDLIDLERH